MAAAAGLSAGSWGGAHPAPNRTRARRLAAVGLNIGAAWLGTLVRRPHANREDRFDAIHRWSAAMMRSLNVTVVRNGEMAPRAQPALIVANHVSWLDICVLGSVDGALFVAKSDLARWPMIGAIARRFGNFFHQRGNIRDAARVKDRVAQALAGGWRVAVFPEGTTSNGAELMPFYPALAQAAVDAASAVQPVAIRYLDSFGALNLDVPFVGDQTFVNSLGKILGQREIIAELTFGEPFSAAGAKRREVIAQAHQFIAGTLGLPECRWRPDPLWLRRGPELQSHPLDAALPSQAHGGSAVRLPPLEPAA